MQTFSTQNLVEIIPRDDESEANREKHPTETFLTVEEVNQYALDDFGVGIGGDDR